MSEIVKQWSNDSDTVYFQQWNNPLYISESQIKHSDGLGRQRSQAMLIPAYQR